MNILLRRFRNAKFSFTPLISYIEKNEEKLFKNINIFVTDNLEQLNNFLEKGEKILICYTGLIGNIKQIISEINQIKQYKDENKKFLIGGPLASGLPEFFLLNGFDYVFIGEGEISFSSFLKYIVEEDKFPVDKIIYGETIDLDQFPPYSYTLNSFPPIEIMRGCYYSCAYCQTPILFSKKVRFRSINQIVETVKIYHKRGIKDFRFLSPNSFSYFAKPGKINYDAIYSLLKQIKSIIGKDKNIFFGTFPSEVRPEYVTLEILKILKEFCYNDKIVLGLQSGSDRILKLINRGHTVEHVLIAVDLLLKNNFVPIVDVMFGFPGETEEEMMETVRISKKIISLGGIIHSHTFLPLPGTSLFTKDINEIPESVKKEISFLTSKGKFFGQWVTQENLRKVFFTCIENYPSLLKDV